MLRSKEQMLECICDQIRPDNVSSACLLERFLGGAVRCCSQSTKDHNLGHSNDISIPALFIRTSIRPHCSSTCLAAAFTDAASLTSSLTVNKVLFTAVLTSIA